MTRSNEETGSQPAQSATVPKYQKERWVYVGKRRIVNGKLAQGFLPIGPDGKLARDVDRPLMYEKLKTGTSAGSIYELLVERTDDSILVTPSSLRYIDRWHDNDQVAEWRAASEASEIAHRGIQREKSDNARNELLDAMRPLRLAYQKTDPRGQQALAVLLLDYLRRPVKL